LRPWHHAVEEALPAAAKLERAQRLQGVEEVRELTHVLRQQVAQLAQLAEGQALGRHEHVAQQVAGLVVRAEVGQLGHLGLDHLVV